MGLLLSITAALGFVALDVLRKVLGSRMDASRVVIGINLGAALFLGLVLVHEGIPAFDAQFEGLALLEATMFTLTSLLYVQAVSLSPLSLTIPYLAATPLVSASAAVFLLGEIPTSRGWTGIALVVVGGLLVHFDRGPRLRAILLAPFKEPGSWRMLLVATIWGFTTSIDKIAIQHGSEALLGFSISALSTLLLLAWRTARRRTRAVQPALGRQQLGLLAVASAIAGLAVLCQFYAYRELLVSYVEAIKRGGGLLSAVIGVTAFKEGSPTTRIPAAILMLAGMLLIAL